MTEAQTIYKAATFISEQKRNGVSDEKMQADFDEYEALKAIDPQQYDGIMFYSTGSKKFNAGWYIRKSPDWRKTWATRFGEELPEIADKLNAQLLPKRKMPTGYQSHDTRKLLNLYAQTLLELERLAFQSSRYYNDRATYQLNEPKPFNFRAVVMEDARQMMMYELKFRAYYAHKAVNIKKLDRHERQHAEDYKLALRYFILPADKRGWIRDDWLETDISVIKEKHAQLLEDCYSGQFINEYVQREYVDTEPRDVPLAPLDKMPVRSMSVRETFQLFLDTLTAAYENRENDDFAFEDAQAAIKRELLEVEQKDVYHRHDFREYLDGLKIRLARLLNRNAEAEKLIAESQTPEDN